MIDRKCLVTGGDSGIGRAAAVMFAMEGADVAINYIPEEQVDAHKVQKTIQALGRECLLVPQDLRDAEGCKRVIETVVKAWGRIDVLVNNASVMYDCPNIADISDEQFHHTIDLNIKGTFFLTRAAVPHMGKGSSIIVTASQVAYAGPPSLIDYTMTKAAQVGMVRGLSNQLIGKGIRVNAVAPGPVSLGLSRYEPRFVVADEANLNSPLVAGLHASARSGHVQGNSLQVAREPCSYRTNRTAQYANRPFRLIGL